ncbi:MAG: stalk domain-containing protein [Syntrophomonadaceae bacterium]
MNIRKAIKVLGLMLTSAVLGAMLAATVCADDPIRLFVNGVEVHSDVPPQVINGRTMVPAAALAQALGARVEWDAANHAVMVYALTSGGTPTDLPSSGSNSSSPGSNSGSSPGNNSNSTSGSSPNSGNLYPETSTGSQSGSSPGSSSGSSPGSQHTPSIPASSTSWTGTWNTSFGEMALVQTGSSVAGTYAYRDGRLSGTAQGNVLTAVWSESPTFTPPDDSGKVVFTMSADGSQFTANWMYGFTGDWWAQPWTGSRK